MNFIFNKPRFVEDGAPYYQLIITCGKISIPMKTSILLLASCFLLISCTTDEASSENARLQISLVDSPAEYDQINIDVQEINVKFGVAEEDEEEEEEESWTNISDFDPQVINILDLVNGEEEVLVDREIPSGTLGEVRLVLGDNNTLVMDDESLDLKVPSGSGNWKFQGCALKSASEGRSPLGVFSHCTQRKSMLEWCNQNTGSNPALGTSDI